MRGHTPKQTEHEAFGKKAIHVKRGVIALMNSFLKLPQRVGNPSKSKAQIELDNVIVVNRIDLWNVQIAPARTQ